MNLIDDSAQDLTTQLDEFEATDTALVDYAVVAGADNTIIAITATAKSTDISATELGISTAEATVLSNANVSAASDAELLTALTAVLNAGGAAATTAAQSIGPQADSLGGACAASTAVGGQVGNITSNRLALQRTGEAYAQNGLGFAAGNALEVLESVETLRGAGPADLEELVCIQGGILLHATGLCETVDEGAYRIHDSLIDGSALAVFEEMCVAQGAQSSSFENERNLLSALGLLDGALNTTEFAVPQPGWIADIDAMALGTVVLELGGGRLNLGDEIDPGVGFVLDAHVGSLMVVDETWITVYHRGELSSEHREIIEGAITLSNDAVDAESRIIEIL